MYLETKTKLIPLVKLVKSKSKIFHARFCQLVVTLNTSATTLPIQKNFLGVDQYARLYP